MRLTFSSSVLPTVSESMLKPLPENNPATRERTPGLFRTMHEIICFFNSGASGIPLRLLQKFEPVYRRSRRDHRRDVLLRLDEEID